MEAVSRDGRWGVMGGTQASRIRTVSRSKNQVHTNSDKWLVLLSPQSAPNVIALYECPFRLNGKETITLRIWLYISAFKARWTVDVTVLLG